MDFFTEFPKLAQDGRRTISVQAASPFAGAHQSELWVFQLLGGHALQILNEDATGYGPYKSAYHNGLRDYQVTVDFDNQRGTAVYRFDGTRYRPAFCESNEIADYNPKLVHRVKCNSR